MSYANRGGVPKHNMRRRLISKVEPYISIAAEINEFPVLRFISTNQNIINMSFKFKSIFNHFVGGILLQKEARQKVMKVHDVCAFAHTLLSHETHRIFRRVDECGNFSCLALTFTVGVLQHVISID